MTATPFRTISAALVLLLVGVIAGYQWRNSARENVHPAATPILQHFVLEPANLEKTPAFPPLPTVLPLAKEKLPPPNATPFRFNGQTIYIVLIS